VVTLRGSFGGNSLSGRRPWPSGGVDSVWLGISAEFGGPGFLLSSIPLLVLGKKGFFFFLKRWSFCSSRIRGSPSSVEWAPSRLFHVLN
jgi:hypothetical protein